MEVSISKAGSRSLLSSVRIDEGTRMVCSVPYPIPDNPQHKATMAIEVKTQDDCENILIVRSAVSIRNNTQERLFVAMLSADQIRDPSEATREQPSFESTPSHLIILNDCCDRRS